MKLLIIRHAQSANNAAVDARVPDPPLTDTGKEQAQLVAGSLQGLGIDLLYVSPMRRTLETAAPIATAINVPPRVFTGLHEWGGIYEEREGKHTHQPGLSRDEMAEIIAGLIMPEDVTAAGWWQGRLDPARMEAIIELSRTNASAYLEYLAGQYPDDVTIGVVTHGGFGSHLMEAALDVQPHPTYILRFPQANTGHARIEITEEDRTLHWHNRTDHLPAELITH